MLYRTSCLHQHGACSGQTRSAQRQLCLGVPRASPARRLMPTASGAKRAIQQSDDRGDIAVALQTVAASVLGGGLLAGAGLGLDEALPQGVQHLSATLGWGYFAVWSLSFYPQVIQNWRRKSVAGLSADYLVYSILGYAAYTVYTGALYSSPGVQAAYITAHAGSAPDVCLADFLFASHAVLASLFTLYQCYLYGDSSDKGSQSGPSSSARSSSAGVLATSRTCQLTAVGVVGAIIAYASHIGSTCGIDDCDAWLPLLLMLGVTKVTMTLIKYTPQALLNAERKSTEGWQINNVLLDLAGGLLSFTQIGLNAVARADMSVITGNPAKLGISAISIGFDILFILQHYVFYRNAPDSSNSTVSSTSSSDVSEPVVSYQRPAEASSGIRKLARRAAAVAVNAAKAAQQPRLW